MIDTILSLIGPNGIFYALGAAIVAALGFYVKHLGRAQERARQDKARLDANRNRKELDDEIADLGPADLDHRFKRWMRDGR